MPQHRPPSGGSAGVPTPPLYEPFSSFHVFLKQFGDGRWKAPVVGEEEVQRRPAQLLTPLTFAACMRPGFFFDSGLMLSGRSAPPARGQFCRFLRYSPVLHLA